MCLPAFNARSSNRKCPSSSPTLKVEHSLDPQPTAVTNDKVVTGQGTSQGTGQGNEVVPEKPPGPPALSHVQISPERELDSQMLELGMVRIEKIDTGEVYQLSTGNIDLPPGKYILRYYQTPIKFHADGSEIEILATTPQTLRIEAGLAEDFQHPLLAGVGAFATYYGEIWLTSWGDRPGLPEKMHYKLDLEVLGEENKPDSPLSRWLKVEITDSDNVYTETAYIKLDVKDWENRKQLNIHEGYIVVNRGLGSKEGSFVVPFDLKHDLLAEKGINLPKRRLSAQDAIALFFAVEDQVDIAAAPIRMARSLLSAKERHEWLGPVKSTKGMETGYNASSWTKDGIDRVSGYRIARGASDVSNPWGIFEIQVDSPILIATCTIKSAGASHPDVEPTAMKIKELKLAAEKLSKEKPPLPPIHKELPQYAKWFDSFGFRLATVVAGAGTPPAPKHSATAGGPGTVAIVTPNAPVTPNASGIATHTGTDTRPIDPPRTQRFDLALMPKTSAFCTLTGKISHGQRSETVILTARTLGTEVIDGKEYRWIEAISTSVMEGKPDYWEGARLLVDAAAYDTSYLFAIKQGWIAYGARDNVFKIPDDRNLDALLETRLQLQQQPQVDRVNVIDVLSMLFNADLTPRTPISKLRAEINGILAGSNRQSIPETRNLRIGPIAGECSKSPEEIPGLSYSFFRSPQVPFGFASVKLKFGVITIDLEVDTKDESLPNDFSASVFGTPTKLSELEKQNRARLPTDPNWRVWTWSDGGKTYMARAEFGGTIKQRTGSDVLLRNKEGHEICVPELSLAKADLDFLKTGRYWVSFKNNQQRVLKEDKGYQLEFLLTDGSESLHSGAPASDDDKKWLNALRTAIKRNANSITSQEHWKDFADFVR
jgi:hypothetical protein